MKVLDLFCGLKGFSEAFEKRDHKVITIDWLEKFNPTEVADIMKLEAKGIFERYGQFDVILASPPCNCFSVASVYRYWENCRPKNEKTINAIKLVSHTLELIINLNPVFWYLENPRGMLRRVLGKPLITTYFGAWGLNYLKPTDIWGFHAKMKWPEKPKVYDKAPRGSKSKVQGVIVKGAGCGKGGKDMRPSSSELRAKIPFALSEAICIACEKGLEKLKK